jgi:protein SCO1/2
MLQKPGVRCFAWLAAYWMAMGSLSARGEGDFVRNELPKSMVGVGMEERLGEIAPVALRFTNSNGAMTSLEEVLRSEKPIILTLNYSNCPGLCIAQLNGLLRGINEVSSLKLGTDFYMISISIDPREVSSKAAGTHKKYSQDLFDQHDPKGWQFWTGDSASIAALTKAVGFLYTYDAKHDQYNHPSAAIFISPQGKITRYLYEIGFTGNTLKMATIEAGEGQVGSPMDMIALWCAHYDPLENRYSTSARRLLSVAAGIFVVIGLTVSVPFWVKRRSRRATKPSSVERHSFGIADEAGSPSDCSLPATNSETDDKL